MVECPLAASDPAEVEPYHRKIAMGERVVEVIHDLVVHRAAELRVRMKHDGDRRVLLPGRVVPAFDPPCGAGEDDLGHRRSLMGERPRPAQGDDRLTATAGARN